MHVQTNLILQLALVVVFAWWSVRTTGSYMGAPLLLVAALYIWHSPFLTGYFLKLSVFQRDPTRDLAVGGSYAPNAVALIGLCLGMTVLGCLIAFVREATRKMQERHPQRLPETWVSGAEFGGGVVRRTIWVLFFVFAAFTLAYFYYEGSRAFRLEYIELYRDPSESFLSRAYFRTQFGWITLVLCTLSVAASWSQRAAVAVSVLGIALLQLMMGARSLPFLAVVAVGVCYDHFVRRIRLVLIVGVCVGLLAFSSVIVQSRESGLGTNVFSGEGAPHEASAWQGLWEISASVNTVVRTMYFCAHDGFAYGLSIGDAVVYVVPREVIRFVFGGDTGITAPGDWLVENSRDIRKGGGFGFSAVAEAYYNFGYYGCLLFLPLGWLVARSYYRWVLRGDGFSFLQSMNVAIVFTLNMRNQLGSYMRVLVYAAAMIAVFRRIAAGWRLVQDPGTRVEAGAAR
ncbi:MAG: O-antigen polysaccharide polymerase Wzy [Deltaproteobacteria bacterium]|nr:O-antigen polysaccharide polymerase Wzy [Deltaproteobacteria bacterium]